jgi:hypothetical protein
MVITLSVDTAGVEIVAAVPAGTDLTTGGTDTAGVMAADGTDAAGTDAAGTKLTKIKLN